MICNLSEIAKAEPHSAYACYVFSLQQKLNFIQRVLPPSDDSAWQSLETCITEKLLPILFGTSISPEVRQITTLPSRLGGLGIRNPVATSAQQYGSSRLICGEHITSILLQEDMLRSSVLSSQSKARREVKKTNQLQQNDAHSAIQSDQSYSETLKRAIQHTSGKGASSWLTALPLQNEGFVFNRADFRDLLRLRYDITLDDMPANCVCGKPYNSQHALTCATGGFILRRHNDIRDFLGNLLTETSHDVQIEPLLAPLATADTTSSNREDGARLDISARGFWRRGQRSFFDVRVFNATAPSNSSKEVTAVFTHHDNEKIRNYGDRILNIEHGSFTPLIYSTFGDCSRLTNIFHCQLGGLLSEKRNSPLGRTMSWLRTKLCYCLLRGVLLCIRGSRKPRQFAGPITTEDINIAIHDAKLI
jgi:hypothetical protein